MKSVVRRCLAEVAAFLIPGVRRKRPPTEQDLRETEFKTSVQGMGLRMTDHIRDVFRFKWVRRR